MLVAGPFAARPASPHRLWSALPLLAAMVLGLLLGGCSTVGTINAIEPKGSLQIVRDLRWGEGARGGLDVYAPSARQPDTPVVVFIYGGGWKNGDKASYGFAGAALARQGFVVVVPDYRLYPEVRWPSFLQDNARAVRWARDHAAEYGGDPSRMALMGHSAGAYNAVMLALDDRWLGAVGMNPRTDLRAVVGLSGPYDFLPLTTETNKAIFGPEAQRPDTQPVNHVAAGAPPMLLITSEKDVVVDPGNVDRLAEKLRAAGDEVEVRRYGGINHLLAVGALAAPLRWMAPVLKDSAAFIDAKARGAGADDARAGGG